MKHLNKIHWCGYNYDDAGGRKKTSVSYTFARSYVAVMMVVFIGLFFSFKRALKLNHVRHICRRSEFLI